MICTWKTNSQRILTGMITFEMRQKWSDCAFVEKKNYCQPPTERSQQRMNKWKCTGKKCGDQKNQATDSTNGNKDYGSNGSKVFCSSSLLLRMKWIDEGKQEEATRKILWKIIYKLLTSSLYRIHYRWCAFPSTQIIFDLEICAQAVYRCICNTSALPKHYIHLYLIKDTLYSNILITKYGNYTVCSLASFFPRPSFFGKKRRGKKLFLNYYNVARVHCNDSFFLLFAVEWHAQPFNTEWIEWTT